MLSAKAVANEMAIRVTSEAMQACGGAAMSPALPIERFFRDARAGSVMAPTTDVLYELDGRALAGHAAAGVSTMTDRLMVGAVAYDAKVVPIWEGIREYFRGAPVEMDFVLFSNYEAQVEALLAGKIDIAWNTNLAFVRVHHATAGDCRGAGDARYRRRVLHVCWSDGPGELASVEGLRGRRWRSAARTRRRPRSCPSTTSRREGLVPRVDVDAAPVRLRRGQARRHGPQRA